MRFDMPLFKIVQRPLVPVMGSWVDAAPFAIFFVLLATAPFFMGRGRRVQLWRRIYQVVSSFTFILFLHRCLCMIRGWVFALKIVGKNDVIAFGHLCMFALLVAMTLSFGRIFCGWLCPIGLFSEIIGWLAAKRAALARRRRLVAGYVTLTGVCVTVAWLAYMVRPGTQYFSENVAAAWGAWLLLLLFFALPREFSDRGMKRVKYLSLGLWLLLSVVGVFVTSPWCTLFGDEVDYSSAVAFLSVLLAGSVLAMAWCRYLCPMGALLGWLARYSPLRLVNRVACTACGKCARVCPMGALGTDGIDQTSCIYCARCVGTCGFAWQRGPDATAPAAPTDAAAEPRQALPAGARQS